MTGSRAHLVRARRSRPRRSRARPGVGLAVTVLLAVATAAAVAGGPWSIRHGAGADSRVEAELARLRDGARGPVHPADAARAPVPGTLAAVVVVGALMFAGLVAYGPRLSALRDPATPLRSRSPPLQPR